MLLNYQVATFETLLSGAFKRFHTISVLKCNHDYECKSLFHASLAATHYLYRSHTNLCASHHFLCACVLHNLKVPHRETQIKLKLVY